MYQQTTQTMSDNAFYEKIKGIVNGMALQWQCTVKQFEKLASRCYVCASIIKPSTASIYLKDSVPMITCENLGILCNHCHRMSRGQSHLLLVKKCINLCNAIDGIMFQYNNVLANAHNCDRYTDMKRRVSAHYVFELTESEYIDKICGKCNYCARPSTSERINGVVMLDSIYGYVADNSVGCCKECDMLKGRMSHDKFVAHVRRIASHIIPDIVTNKLTMTNDMRLCIMQPNPSHTDIVFKNMHRSDNWQVEYTGYDAGDTIVRISDPSEVADNTDVFMIDSPQCKMRCIGLLQSDVPAIYTKYATIDSLSCVEQIIETIGVHRNALTSSSDIVAHIPYGHNCVGVEVHRRADVIVGIVFKMVNRYMECNCVACQQHQKVACQQRNKVACQQHQKVACQPHHMAVCTCGTCIAHIIGSHTNPIKSPIIRVSGTPDLVARYTDPRIVLATLTRDNQLAHIQRTCNAISSAFRKDREQQIIAKLGRDQFDQANLRRTLDYQSRLKREIGDDTFKAQKKEYMRDYRAKNKKDKEPKPVKSDSQKREDARLRKQRQRAKAL
jgi:hypothetical protein